MKALVLKDKMEFEIQEIPVPEIAPDEVLIKVEAVGICGSDVHGMDGSTGRRIPPIVMGHEASGVIEAIGTKVSGWNVGDRVTFDSTIYELGDWYTRQGLYNLSDHRRVLGVSCPEYKRNGAFAEYVNVPEHILYALPDNVSFEQAAMVEPVAVALHALSLTPIKTGDVAVVVGTGMIGLFIIQALRIAGCSKIVAIDKDTDRLNLAKEMGATHIFQADHPNIPNEIRELSHNRGADIAFEVVGISATLALAVEVVRKGAVITLVGNLAQKAEIPLQSVVTRQIRLQGSCAICGEYPAALELIASGKINIDRMISAVVPLEEGSVWFDKLYRQEPGLMKVILSNRK